MTAPTLADLNACDPTGDTLQDQVWAALSRIEAGARLAGRVVRDGCEHRDAKAVSAELRPLAAKILEHATKLIRAVDAIDDAVYDYAHSGAEAKAP